MNPEVTMKMNNLKMKAMHPLQNHQKHISHPSLRPKKKGTQITDVLLDWNHHNYYNKNITDHVLENGVVITRKYIRRTSKDNIDRNPIRNGTFTKCNICQSVSHWALDCPDKEMLEFICLVNNIVLHQNHELKSLVSGTWKYALLDCGASSTVFGK